MVGTLDTKEAHGCSVQNNSVERYRTKLFRDIHTAIGYYGLKNENNKRD